MDQLYVGILGCVSFVVLIFLRVPIAYAMGIVGTAGLLNLSGSYSPKLASVGRREAGN